jgi:cytochrome-b5 reductase
MIAGGSGITPIYQILQAAHKNNDIIEFTLIFGNKSSNDILMKKELDEIAAVMNFKFNLHYLIDNMEDGWNGLTGYINKEIVKQYLPSPAEDTMILLCGPPIMCDNAKSFLGELGHKEDNIYEF